MSEHVLTLIGEDGSFDFRPTRLLFSPPRAADPFSRNNNKTLRQTLEHARYRALASTVREHYSNALEEKLGDFLIRLKQSGDQFYLAFLNPHGDLVYSEVTLADAAVVRLKGLYCFTSAAASGDAVMYIGKSTDSFGKRITQGYGRIHPKNCYRDGQSTNCHLNALITATGGNVELCVSPMVDDAAIGAAESWLIRRYNPPWNVQLRGEGAA